MEKIIEDITVDKKVRTVLARELLKKEMQSRLPREFIKQVW